MELLQLHTTLSPLPLSFLKSIPKPKPKRVSTTLAAWHPCAISSPPLSHPPPPRPHQHRHPGRIPPVHLPLSRVRSLDSVLFPHLLLMYYPRSPDQYQLLHLPHHRSLGSYRNHLLSYMLSFHSFTHLVLCRHRQLRV
jgi:hypothetical protein